MMHWTEAASSGGVTTPEAASSGGVTTPEAAGQYVIC